MPEYDIPLSTMYEAGLGKRVLVEEQVTTHRKSLTLVDRTGDTPHDVVRLSRGEAEELAHVLLAYLNQDNDGTLGYGAEHGVFEEHRSDTGIEEMPEYVEGIGRGVNEYECQRCGRGWSMRHHDEAATHECNPAELQAEDIADYIVAEKPEDHDDIPVTAVDEMALPEWLPSDSDQDVWNEWREQVRAVLQERGFEVV